MQKKKSHYRIKLLRKFVDKFNLILNGEVQFDDSFENNLSNKILQIFSPRPYRSQNICKHLKNEYFKYVCASARSAQMKRIRGGRKLLHEKHRKFFQHRRYCHCRGHSLGNTSRIDRFLQGMSHTSSLRKKINK